LLTNDNTIGARVIGPPDGWISFELQNQTKKVPRNGTRYVVNEHKSVIQFIPLCEGFNVSTIVDARLQVLWLGPSVRDTFWEWKVKRNDGARNGQGPYIKPQHPRAQDSGKAEYIGSWVYMEHILLLDFTPEQLFNVDNIFKVRLDAKDKPPLPPDPTQDFYFDYMALWIEYVNATLPSDCPSVVPL